MKTKQEIEEFLETLEFRNEHFAFYVDAEAIDQETPFYDIEQQVEAAGFFRYGSALYSDAIGYLAEKDPSLSSSLTLANKLGWDMSKIDSEILADLLFEDLARKEFAELKGQIEQFFES